MKRSSSTWAKNLVVAITLGLGAVATWAVTQSPAPVIEAATAQAVNS